MNTRYKRTISARITRYYDDMAWAWQRHKEGFWCGMLFGVLCVVLVTEFVVGLTW